MKTASFLCLAASLLVCSCARNKSSQPDKKAGSDTTVTQHGQAEEVVYYDQSAGMLILEKLGEVYGNPPDVVGFSLDSPNAPDFIEGIYFDGPNLVFQVSGDIDAARKELEKAAGSTNFKTEAVSVGVYSQKRLMELMDELSRRFEESDNSVTKQNVTSFGVGLRFIDINLMVNTPERRQQFRDQIMDSPAFRFNGPETPPVNNMVGANDTLGVFLRPEYTVYSSSAKNVKFILYNYNGEEVTCGEHYLITYEDKEGVWRELPINRFAVDIAYIVPDKKSREFQATLYPEVFPGKPGKYRFFYDVRIRRKEVQMMAEFQLTDSGQELKNAVKTAVPNPE